MKALEALAWRVTRGVILGLAGHGLWAMLLLTAGSSVWPGWLPLALLGGVLVAGRAQAPAAAAASEPAPRWLWLSASILLAVVFVALVYGATATPSRHWDGFVAWEMRATVLSEAPTLRQPHFTDHGVFAQSRDYPVLQPLWQANLANLVGGGGRILFPLLWLLLVFLTGLTLARSGHPSRYAWLGAAGLGLMPMLVSPTSGGVDSGYGETALLLALTAAAAGIVLRDPWLLAAGCALAVWLKPEGSVYAGVIAGTAWWHTSRPLASAAVVATAVALAAWLPAHTLLQLGPDTAAHASSATRTALLLASALAAVGLQPRHDAHGRRIRIALALGLLGIAAAGLVWLLADDHGALGGYATNLRELPERLSRVPALLLALAQQVFAVQRFGLVFVLLLFALWQRDRATLDGPTRTLTWLLALGLLVISVSMLLSPEEDFDHHIRSSLDRLLLQWTGPCTMCIAGWLRPHASAARMPSP